LTYTLISDGSSDRVLIPVINWTLRQNGFGGPIVEQWADFRRIRQRPRSLRDKALQAMELYPCDVMFIHRDAERSSIEARTSEIDEEVRDIEGLPAVIRVVPVRMVEAWLLHDERAIRAAAGNPSGTSALELPRVQDAEAEPDPKTILRAAVLDASELNRRRRYALNTAEMIYRLAELIEDYSPLYALDAFVLFSRQVQDMLLQLV
jgi:hypothetical protein